MARPAELAIVVLAALIAAGLGAALYERSIQSMSPALERLAPTECAGHNYMVNPEGLTLVYSRRAAAFDANNTLITEVRSREIIAVTDAACERGYLIVANKTIYPDGRETEWSRHLVPIEGRPSSFMFLVPEGYATSLPGAAAVPTGLGLVHARYASTSLGTIPLLGPTGIQEYRAYDYVSYEQSMGVLAYRRITFMLANESAAGLLTPHHIIGETVLEKVYTGSPGDNYLYDAKRVVDSVIVSSFSGGALIVAGIIAVLRLVS